VNGELRQEASTRDLVRKIPELIEAITSFMTLEQGDAIATGVPPGRVDVVAGDVVTIEAVGYLELTNPIVAESEYRQKDP
jgi:5-oxopent-3-ene-1,2,5-tricarboxylate decarboxylase/2-hydroxyhepta-2,4-diene-1,7-dioate isomerase